MTYYIIQRWDRADQKWEPIAMFSYEDDADVSLFALAAHSVHHHRLIELDENGNEREITIQ